MGMGRVMFKYMAVISSASSAVAGSNLNAMVDSLGCRPRRCWYNVRQRKGKDLGTCLVNSCSLF